ncbi:hypothetical protein SELMODRAFT_448714 [Selaginella moellendorffii]|uniref:Uncharacterized protein n=1 Tax=Selaginella moellendorffii TaxID=88036 RepID=D8T9L8_SELML|nr:hypothetical protein SELMODRAFT_448714 [Selaginella moellendorffii]
MMKIQHPGTRSLGVNGEEAIVLFLSLSPRQKKKVLSGQMVGLADPVVQYLLRELVSASSKKDETEVNVQSSPSARSPDLFRSSVIREGNKKQALSLRPGDKGVRSSQRQKTDRNSQERHSAEDSCLENVYVSDSEPELEPKIVPDTLEEHHMRSWSLRLWPILWSQQSLLGSNAEENQNNSDLFASMISLLLPNAERDPKAEHFATAAMRCLLITGALSLVAAGDEGCIKEWRMDPSWRHSLYEADLPPARYNPKTFWSILKLEIVPQAPHLVLGCDMDGYGAICHPSFVWPTFAHTPPNFQRCVGPTTTPTPEVRGKQPGNLAWPPTTPRAPGSPSTPKHLGVRELPDSQESPSTPGLLGIQELPDYPESEYSRESENSRNPRTPRRVRALPGVQELPEPPDSQESPSTPGENSWDSRESENFSDFPESENSRSPGSLRTPGVPGVHGLPESENSRDSHHQVAGVQGV